VLLQSGEVAWSVPREWTDLEGPDPEVVLGEGRSPFRVRDLIDLAQVVEQLSERSSPETPDET